MLIFQGVEYQAILTTILSTKLGGSSQISKWFTNHGDRKSPSVHGLFYGL